MNFVCWNFKNIKQSFILSLCSLFSKSFEVTTFFVFILILCIFEVKKIEIKNGFLYSKKWVFFRKKISILEVKRMYIFPAGGDSIIAPPFVANIHLNNNDVLKLVIEKSDHLIRLIEHLNCEIICDNNYLKIKIKNNLKK